MRPIPQQTPDDFAQTGSWVMWPEVVVVTAILPALGFWLRPQDPFFIQQGQFPWLVMPPLLVGLRYGFSRSLLSAVALILAIFLSSRYVPRVVKVFPGGLSLGLLLTGMLAGEFCDMWTRRLHRLGALNQYWRLRLSEFTRTYHLLNISHEQLERRLLTNTQSLRESIYALRRQMLAAQATATAGPLCGLGETIMAIFGSFGWLQTAALLQVDDKGRTGPTAVAHLGEPPPPDPADPLVAAALRDQKLTVLNADADPVQARRGVLAAIPLTDIFGRTWALLLVHEMPFVAFHRDHLNLLAILGGHMGDILATGVSGPAEEFRYLLARCNQDARLHGVPAMLVGLALDREVAPPALAELLLSQRRGLDQQWLHTDRAKNPVVLMLMPLTDREGLDGFLSRVEGLIMERFQINLAASGLAVHSRVVDGTGTGEQLREIFAACQIDGADGPAGAGGPA